MRKGLACNAIINSHCNANKSDRKVRKFHSALEISFAVIFPKRSQLITTSRKLEAWSIKIKRNPFTTTLRLPKYCLLCLPSTLYIRHSPVIKLRSQSGLTFARTLGGNVRNVEGLVIRACDIVRSCYSRAHDTHPEHDVKSKDHVLEAAAHLAGIPSILPHGGHGWETFIYRSCELLAYAPHRHNTPRTDGKRVATTEGITEPPRRRRGDTLYNSYTTWGKLGAHHLRVDHESDDMASGETILREGPLFQPLPRSAPFSERPRASFISLAPSLSLSFSLGLGQSADRSNAPYRNYDCRHCHVTARTARSRINETASKSLPPPALPSSALHFACSVTPGDLPLFSRHPLPPPSLGVPRASTFRQSRWLLSLSLAILLRAIDSHSFRHPTWRHPPLIHPPSFRDGSKYVQRKHVFGFVKAHFGFAYHSMYKYYQKLFGNKIVFIFFFLSVNELISNS